jgi:hypothetical protein
MKYTLIFLILLMFALTSCGQKYNYPGQLEIRSYKIGDKVDTTLFKKYGDLYFPNYLDGWTMENFDKLPEKYEGLPIGLWQLKSDSSIALTLLNDIVLNITVSYMKEDEKEKMAKYATEKLGADGHQKSYEETHPLQAWITYWEIKTWETKDVIFQIGNSDMRKPDDPIPADIRWNLAYSDFILENKIINDYRKK